MKRNEKPRRDRIEILNAGKFVRDAVLEFIQAKTLRKLEAEAA